MFKVVKENLSKQYHSDLYQLAVVNENLWNKGFKFGTTKKLTRGRCYQNEQDFH